MEETLCGKGRGKVWDYVGGEIFFGLAAVAMLLVTVLLPLEEDVSYIRYIFGALFVLMLAAVAAVVYGHVVFARLPDCLLKRIDRTTLWDAYNRRYIKIGDITEVRAECAKNKYGKPYSFGTLTIVTKQGICRIKHADNPSLAKEKIEGLKTEADGW